QLEDGKGLLRRPVVRDLEEHPQVRARHGCPPTRAPSAAPRRLCCRTGRAGGLWPGEARCASGGGREGRSMLLLIERCCRWWRRASTRCFFPNSSYQSSSSSAVVMMVETRL